MPGTHQGVKLKASPVCRISDSRCRACRYGVKVLSTLLKAYSSTSSLCLTREGLPHHSRRTRARECLLTLVGSVSALLAVHVARKHTAQAGQALLSALNAHKPASGSLRAHARRRLAGLTTKHV